MADKTVILRDADGTAYEFPLNQAAGALADGFRQEAPEETKDRELRAWARDNPTLATAAAAARTLSFGTSGFIKSKEQQALKEENPVASGIGEFGGLALPLAGEFGFASKAAQILSESNAVRNAAKVVDTVAKATGAPMAGAAKVGGAVGRVVAGAAPGVGRKALGTAAGLAAESELYHIGANLGEAALGDEELTADRLLANSGQALALGAGLGFGGSLVASGAKAALAKSNAALDKVANFVRKDLVEAGKLQDLAASAKETYVDAATAMSGRPKEVVEGLVSDINTPEGIARRERQTQQVSPEEHEAMGKDLGGLLDETLTSTVKAVKEAGYKEAVPALLKKELTARPLNPVFEDVVQVFKGTRELENKMLADPAKYDTKLVKNVGALRESYNNVFGSKSAADVFEKMLQYRRDLSELISYGKEASQDKAVQAVEQEIRSARSTVNQHLRNESVYGEAANGYAKMDAAWSKFKEVTDPGTLFASNFLKFYKQTGGGKRVEINYPGLQTWLRQIDITRGTLRDMGFEEFYAAVKEINDAVAEVATKAETGYDRSIIDNLHTRAGKSAEKAAERLRENAMLRATTNDTTAMDYLARRAASTTTGAIVGGMFGGPIGAIAGVGAATLYSAVKDPILAGKMILQLERLNAKVDSKTKDAIKGLLGSAIATGKNAAETAGKAVKSTAETASKIGGHAGVGTSVFAMREFLDGFDKKSLPKVQGGDPKDSQRLKDFRQMEALLLDLTANPERAYDRYAQAFKVFQSAAPNLTQRLVEKQLQAAAFLAAKMPKNPSFGKTLNDAINDWRPSDQDIAKFQRYVRAAQDPLSVLDDLKQGTVTREGVETLQALYPALYSNIQQVTMENLSTLQKRLPYYQRINLSLLLNVPVDPSVSPSFVATMQGFYQGSTQDQIQGQKGGQAKAGGSAIHAGAFRNSKLPQSLMTSTQRVLAK